MVMAEPVVYRIYDLPKPASAKIINSNYSLTVVRDLPRLLSFLDDSYGVLELGAVWPLS